MGSLYRPLLEPRPGGQYLLVPRNGLVDFDEFIRKVDVESMERAYRARPHNTP